MQRFWLIVLAGLVPMGELQAQSVCSLEWTLEEELRIGSLDGEDALMDVGSIVVSPVTGEVFVPQPMIGSVLVFSSDGRVTETMGREGPGPGEFEAGPRSVVWADDELWVTDRFRTQSFDADGRPLDFESFQTFVAEEGSTYRPEAPLADGTFWARRTYSPMRPGHALPSELAVRRFAHTGEILDTIAVLDIRGARVVTNPESGGFAIHPLYRSMPGAGLGALRDIVTADRDAIVLIGEIREGRASASFDLLRVGIDGDTILKRAVQYQPRPVDRAQRAWWRDAFASSMAGDSTQSLPGYLRVDDAERNRRRGRARDLLDFPENYPPVRRIMAGADDTIWLLREFDVLEPENRWEVYDSSGELLGRLTDEGGRARYWPWLPRLRFLSASREVVWATTTDDMDVPYLHRFRVNRGCAAP